MHTEKNEFNVEAFKAAAKYQRLQTMHDHVSTFYSYTDLIDISEMNRIMANAFIHYAHHHQLSQNHIKDTIDIWTHQMSFIYELGVLNDKLRN